MKKIPASFIRLLLEAAFLVVVAAAVAIADLRPLAIVLVMAGAWTLVALVERTASRGRAVRRDDAAVVEDDEVARVPVLPSESPDEPETEGEEQTAMIDEHPPQPSPEPVPDPQPEPTPEPIPEPSPIPEPVPGPQLIVDDAVGWPQPDPELEPPQPWPERAEDFDPVPARSPALQAVASPPPPQPPPPQPQPAPVDDGVLAFTPRSNGPRRWNIWDLERLARDGIGLDAARDEERALLLMQLRQFAGADGILPESFDPLVRESFGELIGTARR
jgi:hypothetical protein